MKSLVSSKLNEPENTKLINEILEVNSDNNNLNLRLFHKYLNLLFSMMERIESVTGVDLESDARVNELSKLAYTCYMVVRNDFPNKKIGGRSESLLNQVEKYYYTNELDERKLKKIYMTTQDKLKLI